MSTRCFTYGSLMCEDIMSAVCGHSCHGRPARLAGYARHPVRGEDYPALVPALDDEIEGRLYEGIGDSAWSRLDRFEGHMYSRELVSVEIGRQRLAAWAYVFRPDYRSLLLPGDWDVEGFLREGKGRFLSRYLGFDQIQQ